MAIVVESVGTGSAAGSPLTITKPTGLAVDDLMVAIISSQDEGIPQTNSIGTGSGWTLVLNNNDGYTSHSIQYKVATSADVAAANFSFTGAAGNPINGAILRCSGSGASSTTLPSIGLTANEKDVAVDSATFSGTTTSYTPLGNGALVLMQIGTYDQDPVAVNVTSRSVANTTFTEAYGANGFSGDMALVSGAYGVQTTAAAISTFGATLNVAQYTHHGQLVVFNPQTNATGSSALVSTDSIANTNSGIANTVGSSDFVTTTTTANTHTGRGTAPTQWTNDPKPSTSWSNPDK